MTTGEQVEPRRYLACTDEALVWLILVGLVALVSDGWQVQLAFVALAVLTEGWFRLMAAAEATRDRW